MSYLPCELHCHTVHSDGDFQVRELLENAKGDKLSLIALTDHNTFSGHNELNDEILPAIRGIEWTTYFGHMLVLGAKSFVDWRNAVPDNIDEKILEIKKAQGVVGIAHPYQIGSPVCTGGRWEFNVNNWNNVDYMEIWHEDVIKNTNENDRAPLLWKSLLDKGYKIAATYGRDWHRIQKKGSFGCTYLNFHKDVTAENALDAIRNGRTVVSMGLKFFVIAKRDNIGYNIGDTLKEGEYQISFFIDRYAKNFYNNFQQVSLKTVRLVTNGNKIALELPYNRTDTDFTFKKNQWYTAELWGSVNGESRAVAVTSPFYCEY